MLRIRELTLAGFGVYEQPTRFLVPEGPAVFWGANETGKSTFLWGIAAVWFGLPQNSDPTKIGTSRFRSFSRPEEFWGELVWERDGRVYRLRRDFDRHKVCLTEESSDGGVKELFHGEHNPSGRSSAGTVFPIRLKETIGVGSLDTFMQTFCLTQPFVGEAQIESELQHLISGSRFVKTDDVLAHLFNEVKSLTKNTGELALVRPGNSRPTNQREDGRLESLQSELARARLDLELGRKHLERIHSEGEGVREIEEEAAELRAQIEERTRRLDALSRWTELQNERTKRTETVKRLEGSVAELDALTRDRKELAGHDSLSPIYATAPEDAAERLEALERADRDQAAASAHETAHQQKRKDLEERISELESRLSGEFADVRGRRDWIDDPAGCAKRSPARIAPKAR
ncbi:MAG: AAA family ATPase [Candidatus Eisenbacteria bacterium]